MMFSAFNLVLFFSLWSTILARPFLSAPSLVPRAYDIEDPSLPAAVKTVCIGGANATTVMDSLPYGTDGAFLTTGSCAPPETTTSDSSDTPSDSSLAARQACRGTPNDCVSRFGTQFSGQGFVSKCGAPCTSACYPGSGGPDPNDCQFMINSLYNNSPQLFTLTANKFLLFTYKTCGIGLQNQIASSPVGCSQTMVYDYSDIGSVARYLAWNCQGSQGARGGRCTGNTGVFQSNIPDFYVQVYRN